MSLASLGVRRKEIDVVAFAKDLLLFLHDVALTPFRQNRERVERILSLQQQFHVLLPLSSLLEDHILLHKEDAVLEQVIVADAVVALDKRSHDGKEGRKRGVRQAARRERLLAAEAIVLGSQEEIVVVEDAVSDGRKDAACGGGQPRLRFDEHLRLAVSEGVIQEEQRKNAHHLLR